MWIVGSHEQNINFQKLPFVYHFFIHRIRAEILHVSTAVKRTLLIFFRNDEQKGLSQIWGDEIHKKTSCVEIHA